MVPNIHHQPAGPSSLPSTLGPGNLPGTPEDKHKWNNITSKTKNLFGGIKDKWNSNTPSEKRYLMAAAAIIAIVALIFAVLMMVFGMGSAMQLLPSLMPLAFGAMWPMLMYAQSKHNRKPATPKELQKQEVEKQRIASATKATRIYNKAQRKKLHAASTS